MVGTEYSDCTPAVTYEYGDDDADENGVGRVTEVADGAMTRTYGYDVDGNVARETATQHPDPFGKGSGGSSATWTTRWNYDSLARLGTSPTPTVRCSSMVTTSAGGRRAWCHTRRRPTCTTSTATSSTGPTSSCTTSTPWVMTSSAPPSR